MLLYLRFHVNGRYVTMFWAALHVGDATAQGLLDIIEKHFEAMRVPFSKFYSFASDGASVVSSEDGGVAGLLAEYVNAYVLSIHCVAHRQALVMKDAVKTSTWAEWFDATLGYAHWTKVKNKQRLYQG